MSLRLRQEMVSSPVLVWKRWPDTPTMSPTSSFFTTL